MSFFVGGLRHKEQHYNAHAASVHATSLVLAVTGLLMPALFALGAQGETVVAARGRVSGTVAAVLIGLYLAALAFMLITHEHSSARPRRARRPPGRAGVPS